MGKNVFTDAEAAITKVDLGRTERSLKFTFPQEVRSHYLRWNGGSPKKCILVRNEIKYVVHQFLPVKHGRHTLEGTFRSLKLDKEVLPTHLVPFAIDPGGDYYCFSIRESDAGSTWIYRGEYFDDPERAATFLTSSFSSFVDDLVLDED